MCVASLPHPKYLHPSSATAEVPALTGSDSNYGSIALAAKLASMAYDPDLSWPLVRPTRMMDLVADITTDISNVRVIFASGREDGQLFVAVRGTAGKANIFADLEANAVWNEQLQLYVHAGFNGVLQEIIMAITANDMLQEHLNQVHTSIPYGKYTVWECEWREVAGLRVSTYTHA